MGEHGTDGLVTCSKVSGCDDIEKPDSKKCAATPACGKQSSWGNSFNPYHVIDWIEDVLRMTKNIWIVLAIVWIGLLHELKRVFSC